MTIETNLKSLLGEYIFQICALQHQLEEANKELLTLRKTEKKNEK